jgi:RHS repeat-associated protein
MNVHPITAPASPSLASPLFDASCDSIESLTTSFVASVVPTLETTTVTDVALGYHRNQQYSITAMTTSTGAVAERYAYTAYGQPTILNASGTVLTNSAFGNRYTYTGREWDETLGLHHFRARWMSPLAGRFLGRDPIGYVGGYLLVAFLNHNPQSLMDPSGNIYTYHEYSTGSCAKGAIASFNAKWDDGFGAPCDGYLLIWTSATCSSKPCPCSDTNSLPNAASRSSSYVSAIPIRSGSSNPLGTGKQIRRDTMDISNQCSYSSITQKMAVVCGQLPIAQAGIWTPVDDKTACWNPGGLLTLDLTAGDSLPANLSLDSEASSEVTAIFTSCCCGRKSDYLNVWNSTIEGDDIDFL